MIILKEKQNEIFNICYKKTIGFLESLTKRKCVSKVLFITICFFSINIVAAQKINTVYYDSIWIQTTKNKAVFIEDFYKKDDTTYVIKKYKINNTPIFEGEYYSLNPLVENGKLKFYDKKGRIEFQETYLHGLFYGCWNFYDTTGHITRSINYSKAYYYLSKLTQYTPSYVHQYKSDSMPLFKYNSLPVASQDIIKINFTARKGEDLDYFQRLEPFKNYLFNNIIYPRRAEKLQITDKIICEFIIDENGTLINPQLYNIQPLNDMRKDLIFEVFRILLDSPLWNPGFSKGKHVSFRFRVIVEFNCNA
jgi:hypothetical protein